MQHLFQDNWSASEGNISILYSALTNMSASHGQIFEKQDQAILKKMNVKRREEIFSQLTGEDAVPFGKVELESS